jgi:hypothetical protein
MKKLIIVTLLYLILTLSPTLAQTNTTVNIENSSITVKAFESIYNGNKTLVIQISEGKVPLNAPAERLSLSSDGKNHNKTFSLLQISPGKYVVTEPVIIEEGIFKLNLAGCSKLKNVELNFSKPSETKK